MGILRVETIESEIDTHLGSTTVKRLLRPYSKLTFLLV